MLPWVGVLSRFEGEKSPFAKVPKFLFEAANKSFGIV
jgi:hypothetical protein